MQTRTIMDENNNSTQTTIHELTHQMPTNIFPSTLPLLRESKG